MHVTHRPSVPTLFGMTRSPHFMQRLWCFSRYARIIPPEEIARPGVCRDNHGRSAERCARGGGNSGLSLARRGSYAYSRAASSGKRRILPSPVNGRSG